MAYCEKCAALEIELGTLLWNLEQCAALAIRTSKTDFSAEHDGRIRAPLLAVSSFVRDVDQDQEQYHRKLQDSERREAALKAELVNARKEVEWLNGNIGALQLALLKTDHSDCVGAIAKLETYITALWGACNIRYWPRNGDYPILHSQHVTKLSRDMIEEAVRKDGVLS